MLPSSDESSTASPPMIHHFKGSIRSNANSDPIRALLANGYSFRLQDFANLVHVEGNVYATVPSTTPDPTDIMTGTTFS